MFFPLGLSHVIFTDCKSEIWLRAGSEETNGLILQSKLQVGSHQFQLKLLMNTVPSTQASQDYNNFRVCQLYEQVNLLHSAYTLLTEKLSQN